MTGNRRYSGEEKEGHARMMVKGGPTVRAWMETGQETLGEMSPRRYTRTPETNGPVGKK